MTGKHVVVVGAGHAGGTLAALLRRDGFDGPITVIGAEIDPPYHRPPLSKSFADDSVKWLYGANFYAEQDITLQLGQMVLDVDAAAKQVQLGTGAVIDYDILVLATGAEPRRLPLPGDTLAGIHTLRERGDASVLREAFNIGRPLVIIGGGYIGLEVAAAARALGVEVTILEREERILGRVASPALSELLSAYHREQGTEIRTGVEIAGFRCDRGFAGGVELANGQSIECGTVLVGAGATPRVDLAKRIGLELQNGITVDDSGRTNDPSIYAIGDVSNRPVDTQFSIVGRMRLESIPSAVEQARHVAEAIMGKPRTPDDVPWFWSDQFDLKLKIAGIVYGEYETAVRGDPGSGSYSLFHHANGRLVAAETVNASREFMVAKRILATRGSDGSPANFDPTADLLQLVRN
ncbi:ferredoxin reductase [Arthrobacter sp. UCD-GKA]|uniref:NAD(P)/FAD-dependent oxidoreductase n=1 Tax=Arthrobacter sp. UCD-GKA TaxID=1913576 RepID=UPI0008DD0F6F|nr:FAD-dependent oxidoreductase [Arthrobacter sp. UCD-GKA]OIH85191.1 ferredoxin reductase [Arthrobacter sp. UCD-GKA]